MQTKIYNLLKLAGNAAAPQLKEFSFLLPDSCIKAKLLVFANYDTHTTKTVFGLTTQNRTKKIFEEVYIFGSTQNSTPTPKNYKNYLKKNSLEIFGEGLIKGVVMQSTAPATNVLQIAIQTWES